MSKERGTRHKFSTRAIHAGQKPDERTGAVAMPITLSTNYLQDGIGEPRGYEYIRTNNPTREALEICIASLEEAEHGFAFASGIAGIDAVFRLLKPGDEVILCGIVYGGTIKLLEQIYAQYGIGHTIAGNTAGGFELSDLERAITPKTKMVWLESPANPYFNIVDLKKAGELDKSAGALAVADNTVATPYLQNPLNLGIDISLHSATKYLGGHSDVLGGLVAVNSDELAERIKLAQSAAGAVLSPFDSYMVLRGIKTLGVRVEQISKNAKEIAEFLESHKNVSAVNYAGLKSHPGHKTAKSQMRGFGGLMSFVLKGAASKERAAAAKKLAKNLELAVFSESLGAVETIISHPATMSHYILGGTSHEIDGGLLRLSVGLEDPSDITADLAQALD